GGSEARMELRGELNLQSAARVAERLSEVEAHAPAVLTIDLRGLEFMDSSGLRELFLANRRAREQGRRLVLVRGSDQIDRVLDLVRADARLETVEDPGALPDRT